MAQCFFCGAETILLESGRPICVQCSKLIDAGKTPPKKPPARESGPDEQKTRKAGS